MRASAALLALLLLAPLAGADHAFSHRVYVVGRVLDAEGRPAPGLPVETTFEGLEAGGRCFDAEEEVTGPMGDYVVCRHAHVIPPDARVLVRVRNATASAGVDPDLRHAVANLRLEEPAPFHDLAGERRFDRTFTVSGRAFALLAEPENAEGIQVDATPLAGNLTVQLVSGAEVVAEERVQPNEHGLYEAHLDVGDLSGVHVVRVRAGADVTEELVDREFRRADVNVVRDLRLLGGPGSDAPGSETPFAAAWLVLGGLLLTAVAARRRG